MCNSRLMLPYYGGYYYYFKCHLPFMVFFEFFVAHWSLFFVFHHLILHIYNIY